MATIRIDGRDYEVDGEQNLLHVALELGFDLPYFCWHPALGSVGACRQCAVKQFRDGDDEAGEIVMACMTPAAEGTRISIADDEAVAFRAQVVEWLMLNHPHDCPICDEGGECHLQDMTVMTGHTYRETRFPKRTYRNQYLGPLINHEMNRCIQCYRCVRFYRDYAGGDDLDVLGAHDHVYFGRQEEGVLESPFAGNLVEVCPTGVFTDKTLKRHYTRKWDLQMAPSVCAHCAVGCNTTPGERYGTLRRIVNRYNGAVNGYFLCDRGRFGYEFVNGPDRLRTPRVAASDGPVSPEDAVDAAAALLRDCDRVIGIGSPRGSLEANVALRTLVGADDFFTGLGRREAELTELAVSVLTDGPAPSASLRQAEASDAVLVLGEDVQNTAPRLALSLRQTVNHQPLGGMGGKGVPPWHDEAVRYATHGQSGPLYVATPDATALDDVATRTLRAAPDDVARLGFAVAHAVDPAAPPVDGLDDDTAALAREIADALAGAEQPLVVAGPSCGAASVIRAAANVAWALRRTGHAARIHLTAREANTVGVALLGGGTLEEACHAVEEGEKVGLVVLEHDLTRTLPEEAAARLLDGAGALVVMDHSETDTLGRAHVALPAGTFAESEGTVVSSEGRAQRFFRVIPEAELGDGSRDGADAGVRESWRWLGALQEALAGAGDDAPEDFDELVVAVADTRPVLAGVAEAAPDADTRLPGGKVPRQPERYSGRTAMHADRDVSEPQRPADPASALAYSMEGTHEQPPSALLPMFRAPGWNSIQAVNKFQDEIAGPLRGGDPGVRLLEPDPDADPPYFDELPAPYRRADGRWLFLPAWHVFGSEELSARAPGVAELAPEAYVGLADADARALSVEEGDEVRVAVDGRTVALPVRMRPELPAGVALIPAGLDGVPTLDLPATGSIETRPAQEEEQA